MMLCGIFLLLMLWSCEGARLAGENGKLPVVDFFFRSFVSY